MDDQASNVIELTNAITKEKLLVDIDLIVAAGDNKKLGATMLISFTGPIMPVLETKEFVMKHKRRLNTQGETNVR